jgi:hypothetical protein
MTRPLVEGNAGKIQSGEKTSDHRVDVSVHETGLEVR